MSTIVGILTFITRINTTAECYKQKHFIIFQYFTLYEQLKFHAQLSMKNVLKNLRADLLLIGLASSLVRVCNETSHFKSWILHEYSCNLNSLNEKR